MIRMPRVHIAAALFYVTARGDNKNNIFADPADYKFYLQLLRKYKQQYGFKLFAFCLLPEHLHLLIELRPGLTISEIMHDLNANYTKYFNGKYGRKGHLFRERYKLVLAEKSGYLLALTAYIHLNPVVSGLTRDYEYSSYAAYVAGGPRSAAVIDIEREIEEVEGLHHGIKYEDCLRGISGQQMASLGADLRKRQLFGSAEFLEKIKQEAANLGRQAQSGQAEIKKLHSVNRKFVFAGSMIIVALGLFTVYSYARIWGLKDNFNKELQQKEVRLSAEMDSYYKEMSRTLQIERQKARYLEGLLEGRKRQ